jgi:hypothetical protein
MDPIDRARLNQRLADLLTAGSAVIARMMTGVLVPADLRPLLRMVGPLRFDSTISDLAGRISRELTDDELRAVAWVVHMRMLSLIGTTPGEPDAATVSSASAKLERILVGE